MQCRLQGILELVALQSKSVYDINEEKYIGKSYVILSVLYRWVIA